MYYVYRFVGVMDKTLYVGKTKNIKQRMNAHFSTGSHLPKELYERTKKIEFIAFVSEFECSVMELFMINHYAPKLNEVDKYINNGERRKLKELKLHIGLINKEPKDIEWYEYRKFNAHSREEEEFYKNLTDALFRWYGVDLSQLPDYEHLDDLEGKRQSLRNKIEYLEHRTLNGLANLQGEPCY